MKAEAPPAPASVVFRSGIEFLIFLYVNTPCYMKYVRFWNGLL